MFLFNLFFVCLFVQAFWPLQMLGTIVTIIIIILANISTVMGTLMVNVPGYSCWSWLFILWLWDKCRVVLRMFSYGACEHTQTMGKNTINFSLMSNVTLPHSVYNTTEQCMIHRYLYVLACVSPLGLTNKKLPNSALTASSEVRNILTVLLLYQTITIEWLGNFVVVVMQRWQRST